MLTRDTLLTSAWLHKQVAQKFCHYLGSKTTEERQEIKAQIEANQKVRLSKHQISQPKFTLSTLGGEQECVDYFLTMPSEPLFNFLALGSCLKMNFHDEQTRVQRRKSGKD
jgi:hypothetical protein